MPKRTPISVLIPVYNEHDNIRRCLEPLADWADEIVVVDSQSTDDTVKIAESYGAKALQFHYEGGWPKKRQWAMDTHAFRNDWILLLDVDEILDEGNKKEIAAAIESSVHDGYWLRFQIFFLGKQLRYGDTQVWKLSLLRRGKGRYEKRLENQDEAMWPIEIHEHVVVDGTAGRLQHPVRHENVNSLARYIEKHNIYSNWAAKVWTEGTHGNVEPDFFGSQAQRRRWLMKRFLRVPGSPLMMFAHSYLLHAGFLDGTPGLVYSTFRAIQIFHTKAKIWELEKLK